MTRKELIQLIFKERGIILLPLSKHHESTEMIMSGYFEDKWEQVPTIDNIRSLLPIGWSARTTPDTFVIYYDEDYI